jgi:hypothetical protein
MMSRFYLCIRAKFLSYLLQQMQPKRDQNGAHLDCRWVKLEVRQIKVNVDGSFHSNMHTGAAGAVARDHDGRFLAAASVFLPNAASASVAEALAMRAGLALANRLGCHNVVMESDSIETVEACT